MKGRLSPVCRLRRLLSFFVIRFWSTFEVTDREGPLSRAFFCWLLARYGHKDRNFSPYSRGSCPYGRNDGKPFDPIEAVFGPKKSPFGHAGQLFK